MTHWLDRDIFLWQVDMKPAMKRVPVGNVVPGKERSVRSNRSTFNNWNMHSGIPRAKEFFVEEWYIGVLRWSSDGIVMSIYYRLDNDYYTYMNCTTIIGLDFDSVWHGDIVQGRQTTTRKRVIKVLVYQLYDVTLSTPSQYSHITSVSFHAPTASNLCNGTVLLKGDNRFKIVS